MLFPQPHIYVSLLHKKKVPTYNLFFGGFKSELSKQILPLAKTIFQNRKIKLMFRYDIANQLGTEVRCGNLDFYF